MPKTTLAKRLKALRASSPAIPGAPGSLPRLWNAHKRIETGRIAVLPWTSSDLKQEMLKAAVAKVEAENTGSTPPEEKKTWQKVVTPDIVDFIENSFIDDKKVVFSPRDRYHILRNPLDFFSRPKNVPVQLRKQIYFPKFTVVFYRTPHLPPKYAAFEVPLWFNKLDLKSYLSSVYNVEVLHIRSHVIQAKVTREQPNSRGPLNRGQGRLKRPTSKKTMTVELVEPFVWPEEIKDLSPWEHDTYWASGKENMEFQKAMQPEAILRPNEKHRKSIAEQAKELLEGKTQWKPTWQSIATEARIVEGEKPLRPSAP